MGIYSTSEYTLAFVLGDPAAQVKFHPSDQRCPGHDRRCVRAQIKAAVGAISDYDLSAGTVYAIVFSSGNWAFAKY